ncbi:hypothetical protein AAFF_G00407630 [Aldrovandia affinis]|uniref:Uncharacterized protein n=1 Tax=Aldrovandia affinis TaxID=143900 RepID=A0AAD7WJZ9_9TELE|nr:hypothetical protein AAFF_G00407630 [Aldrovandia affinis]
MNDKHKSLDLQTELATIRIICAGRDLRRRQALKMGDAGLDVPEPGSDSSLPAHSQTVPSTERQAETSPH